jgi:hypothetical protein
MASAAKTADWVSAERRKQNAVLLALLIACLLVAVFPRNERRLFAFNGERGTSATIAPPVQTRLRAGIFGQPASRRADNSPVLQVPPEFTKPMLEPIPEWIQSDDPWRRGLGGEPLQFGNDGQLPGLADLTGSERPKGKAPDGPRFFGYIPKFVAGGVPEPGTWAMMIMGVGAVAYRSRAAHSHARRRRGHERWRRSLVPPAPERAYVPQPRLAISSVAGPWGLHAGVGSSAPLGLGLHDPVNLASSAREEQRDQRGQYRADQEFARQHLQSPPDWLVRREEDIIVPIHIISRIAI